MSKSSVAWQLLSMTRAQLDILFPSQRFRPSRYPILWILSKYSVDTAAYLWCSRCIQGLEECQVSTSERYQ
ncbi:hypothetical protein BDV26DRAFT_272535 [Aspergillus bertholletiae]|uniref:Uncharacterized protein n=1 Tax=Aspergillus bertholletiae TaxID=1226010 RepID=A0A5N7ATR2_9EURO|nr:hypothetical protein BDV26DRAFT_272535 [Aspergillus bertholletiae]